MMQIAARLKLTQVNARSARRRIFVVLSAWALMRPNRRPIRIAAFAALTATVVACAAVEAGPAPEPEFYGSLSVESIADETGGTISRDFREAATEELKKSLGESGFTVAEKETAQADLQASILSCAKPAVPSAKPKADGGAPNCVAAAVITDNKTENIVTKLAIPTPGPGAAETKTKSGDAAAMAKAIAAEVAALPGRTPSAKAAAEAEDITATGVRIVYRGNGVFAVGPWPNAADGGAAVSVVDLKHVAHAHDPAVDKDVPYYTNVTLNDVVPKLVDAQGREYARITLYHINPPLIGLPSREPGIDRGMDFRDPADLVKAAYSNYVSPVLTNDAEQRRVAGHPIGHFYVKVEIPRYPTVLTGMTTIKRADTELMDLTVGRELGIGGVLLTPEPGRLNSASEAIEELTLRQRELRVVDGLYYRRRGGRNTGPEYVLKDGNVAFARFIVPVKNAKDALAYFVEFVARGEHNVFGSLINRPNKGTGSGCTPFAISWLEASGVIPFVAEPVPPDIGNDAVPESFGAADFWKYLLRSIDIPWSQIGCDDRVGAAQVNAASYTIYDLLFHRETTAFIEQASEGLAQKIKDEYGVFSGTLFQFGALTPIRDLVIQSRRKDPDDRGDYGWAKNGEAFATPFWDNGRFANWIRRLWTKQPKSANITLVREGRFHGIEVDAMNADRQKEPFFAEANQIPEKKRRLEAGGVRPSTCQQLFSLGLQ
jgi:hypothetical protein